ncbi:type II toxin-antitoxin system VapC family toxin [Bacteroidota bacterium]
MKNTCLIDTNLIVYALNKDSEFHKECLAIMSAALNGKLKAAIAEKSLYEFYAITTDKRRVEKPVSVKKATEIIELLIGSKIDILYSSPASISKTIELIRKYKVRKQDIFDYVLIGIMLASSITQIYTYNKKDFSRIKEIRVLEL